MADAGYRVLIHDRRNCGRSDIVSLDVAVEGRALASPQKLENRILDLIRQDRPEWEAKRGICPSCLETYRAKKFIGYLEAEYQKLSELEHAVVDVDDLPGRQSLQHDWLRDLQG